MLDLVDPYTAALLLPGMDLDDDIVGHSAARVLVRWHEPRAGEGIRYDSITAGDNTGDLLFRLLADRPRAAAAFLERAAAHPQVLFRSAEHEASVVDVLAAGTHPSVVDARGAGLRLRPLLDWARDHESQQLAGDGITERLPWLFAGAMTPWLLSLGDEAAFGWTQTQAKAALAWVVRTPEATRRMIAALPELQEALGRVSFFDDRGVVRSGVLDDVGEAMTLLQTVLREACIDQAAAARVFTDVAVAVGTWALASIAPLGDVGDFAAELVLAAATPMIVEQLARLGVIHTAPRDEAAVQATFAAWSAATAVAVVIGFTAQAIAAGLMPKDALGRLDLSDIDPEDGCVAEVVDDRLRAFLDDLSDEIDPTTANASTAVLNQFSNNGSKNAACNG